jgi:hypothetical protein
VNSAEMLESRLGENVDSNSSSVSRGCVGQCPCGRPNPEWWPP